MQVRAAPDHTVVASGDLVDAMPTGKAGRPSARIWHYRVITPAPARAVVLAIGPWRAHVAERATPALRTAVAESVEPAEDATAAAGADTAMPTGADPAMTGFARREAEEGGLLAETMGALRLVQAILEQWLLCAVPWPMYSLVFVPESVLQGGERHSGPGITVLSEDDMCPRKALEQRRGARTALAGALAEQWLGQLLTVDSPADEWLLWGLQGYVQALFIKSAYGGSELAYLRLKERDAVRSLSRCMLMNRNRCHSSLPHFLRACKGHQLFCITCACTDGSVFLQVVKGDGGLVPPLSWRNAADSVVHTVERLHCIRTLRLKATAVMHILSSKCGNDAFLSILRGLLQTAQSALQKHGAERLQDDDATAVPDAESAGSEAVKAAKGGTLDGTPWVLQTGTLLKQIAQVQSLDSESSATCRIHRRAALQGAAFCGLPAQCCGDLEE